MTGQMCGVSLRLHKGVRKPSVVPVSSCHMLKRYGVFGRYGESPLEGRKKGPLTRPLEAVSLSEAATG